MNKDNLTKQDYENLNALIQLNQSIIDNYKRLAKLEIQGLINSEVFFNNTKTLKSKIQKEDKIINRLNRDPKIIVYVLQCLQKSKQNIDTITDIRILTYDEFDINTRIIAKLQSVFKLKYRNTDDLLPNSIKEIFSVYLYECLPNIPLSKKLFEKSKSYLHEIAISITNDIYYLLASLLEREITRPYNKNIGNELIKCKYKISYYCPYLEYFYLKNNFCSPKEIYLGANFTAGIYGLKQETLEKLRTKYIKKRVTKEIVNLLSIDAPAYEYNKILVETMLRKILIKSFLQFLSEEDLLKIDEGYHVFLKDKINKCDKDYHKSEELVTCAFRSYNKVKKKVIKVTYANAKN